jgi:hypothetical protein
MARAGAAHWSLSDEEEKVSELENKDMSNDLEQPSGDSSNVVVGGSVVAPPRDSAVEAPAGENVPLPKEEEVAPKRRPRVVKKKPVVEKVTPKAEPIEVVVDPMFFAGLNTTLKMMVQQERRHHLSSMAIV